MGGRHFLARLGAGRGSADQGRDGCARRARCAGRPDGAVAQPAGRPADCRQGRRRRRLARASYRGQGGGQPGAYGSACRGFTWSHAEERLSGPKKRRGGPQGRSGRPQGRRPARPLGLRRPGGSAGLGGIKPEFSLCSSGQRQSPIDIRGGLAVDLEPVNFDYPPSHFAVVDNGHTVQVNVAPGSRIEVGGKRFELQQFHFHRPSEERIDGRQFEMSVHLVHKDEQGRLAVVTVLFDKGSPQPVVQKVWNHLPLERHEAAAARVPLELAELLPADRRYYTYMGSLTTPPCTEGVQWIVMRQPVTLAPEQIELFARIYPMNARPLQAASGRRIMQSN
ncbi:MAG: carbonic anhydrase family protein [Rubrivivax sp.]|nr:carbonic anhydrase family protein [Rubrivivax sp.]